MDDYEHFADRASTRTQSLEQKVIFFLVSVGVMTLTYGFFYLIDFLPENKNALVSQVSSTAFEVTGDTRAAENASSTEDVPPMLVEPLPIRMHIDALDRTVPVLNPESRLISALDAALLEGVVRHPDSADFITTGTIFILGHSSYLPNVLNKNFQALNGIQDLRSGDTIRLESTDGEYIYAVDRVYEAKASAASVPIQWTTAKLVIATCDSFGTKDDRFIVEATLVEAKPRTI